MGASPKNKREAPERRFEDYVLTYEVGPGAGLYPISSDRMQYVPGPAGLEYFDDAQGDLDIGFSFTLGGVTYRRAQVSTNGWCCLREGSSLSTSDVMTVPYDNKSIKGQFTGQPLLLAPWFDDLRTTLRGPTSSNALTYLNNYRSILGISESAASLRSKMMSGEIPCSSGFDSETGGIKFFRGNSKLGKFLLIRWRCFTDYLNPVNIAMFDAVLYESGHIEFRYVPRTIERNLFINESATIGIFSHGGTVGFPRYRDFGYALKKDAANDRGQFINGGTTYKAGFLDGTEKYTVSLNSFDHWPGRGQFGAVFRFSPPRVRHRQKKTVTTLRDSVSFVNRDSSFFDDRIVVPLGTQSVEYPSMLPSTFKINNSSSDPVSAQELFQTGSITVNRSITHGLFETALSDSIIEGKLKGGR